MESHEWLPDDREALREAVQSLRTHHKRLIREALREAVQKLSTPSTLDIRLSNIGFLESTEEMVRGRIRKMGDE